MLAAISEGAVLRVRPRFMIVATIMAGLMLIMWGGGVDSEVMQRIAMPTMVGALTIAPLLLMLVIPALYRLLHRRC